MTRLLCLLIGGYICCSTGYSAATSIIGPHLPPPLPLTSIVWIGCKLGHVSPATTYPIHPSMVAGSTHIPPKTSHKKNHHKANPPPPVHDHQPPTPPPPTATGSLGQPITNLVPIRVSNRSGGVVTRGEV